MLKWAMPPLEGEKIETGKIYCRKLHDNVLTKKQFITIKFRLAEIVDWCGGRIGRAGLQKSK
jgi:hypothetical protein